MRNKHRELRCRSRKIDQKRKKTVQYNFSQKHLQYIRNCVWNVYNIAEGAVRAGKTVDNVYAFAHELKTHPDKLHLATGSTGANAKLNIGDCNGMGLESIFRGQCKWGKYKGNECLIINGPDTGYREKVVIFAGAALASSFKKIRGNSYGMWIATEVNLHHDNTIKEAFNRTLASHNRKFFWDLNPDHPKAKIYTDYIDKYVAKHKTGELKGGVNYDKFTIFDNINISKENREAFLSQYEPGSIWYNRDILGMRCIGEGLIYTKLASEFSLPEEEKKPHSLTVDEAKQKHFIKIVISVDFGGNGSGHAFVATGITEGYKEVVALKSRRYKEGEVDQDTRKKIKDVDPDMLGKLFVKFVQDVKDTYGFVTHTYADSAESVLIRGLKKAMNAAGLGNIAPKNALKGLINDRIFTLVSLSVAGRFFYVEEECGSLMGAISTAIWDPKNLTENVRLDDGTSDIDSMDAFEYCFERDIKRLIKKGGGGT